MSPNSRSGLEYPDPAMKGHGTGAGIGTEPLGVTGTASRGLGVIVIVVVELAATGRLLFLLPFLLLLRAGAWL